MGCCDDDRSQTARSINENDDEDQEETEAEDVVNPQEQVQQDHDIWATSEGYTPLADLNPYNTAGSMMVSFGVGDDDSDDDGENNDSNTNNNSSNSRPMGAFFVNPSAFVSAYDDGFDEDDDDEQGAGESEFIVAENTPSEAQSDDRPLVDDNFHSIADNALRVLDQEYERTLRGERPPRWTEQPMPSTASATNEKHEGTTTASTTTASNDVDQNSTQQQQEGTTSVVDEDLKVIVEAFDKRKKDEAESGAGDGAPAFDVDWEKLPASASSATTTTPATATIKPLPPVDTDAVRKAVTEISQKTEGNFQQKFEAWQERQQRPETHDLIPKIPFKAFQRSTDKAKLASATLSRSATIAEALVRLVDQGLLVLDESKTSLSIHVIGVDHVECETIERIQTFFRPIVRWLGVWNKCQHCTKIYLRLSGRDLDHPFAEPVNLLTPDTATRQRFTCAIATCHSGLYDEWLEQEETEAPDLAIAFNAGVWGYKEWATTIAALNRRSTPAAVAITAYTLEECQEDAEVIQDALEGTTAKTLWEPERNPFGSNTVRETKSSTQEYRENACWQAWLLGG